MAIAEITECSPGCPVIIKMEAQKGFMFSGIERDRWGKDAAAKAEIRFSHSRCEHLVTGLCYLLNSLKNHSLWENFLTAEKSN